MRCPYGNDNMILVEDEFLWHCPHCGYEKFAKRSAYNSLKREARKAIKDSITIEQFADMYVLREMASKAYSKVTQEK